MIYHYLIQKPMKDMSFPEGMRILRKRRWSKGYQWGKVKAFGIVGTDKELTIEDAFECGLVRIPARGTKGTKSQPMLCK